MEISGLASPDAALPTPIVRPRNVPISPKLVRTVGAEKIFFVKKAFKTLFSLRKPWANSVSICKSLDL